MPRSSLPVLAIVAVSGAATMTVELSAVRMLAPWFGASAGVWTNVIGVILLALALGYRLGARLARGARPLRRLAATLLVSAAATAWLPAAARPVAEAFLPQGLALDQVSSLLAWGSLASALLLFLPAAVALGCVAPLAVEALSSSLPHAGDAGGRVLAASTLGSLAGTFATTHLFLPSLGIDLTYLGAAMALALAGVFAALAARAPAEPPRPGTPGVALGAVLVAVAGLAFSRSRVPAVPRGERLLAARQSAYQFLRVIEAGEGDERLVRLVANESLDSFQSVGRAARGLLPDGYYYNLFTLPPWWAGARPDEPWRLLVLGLGAGTAVAVIEDTLPQSVELSSFGVEIDPVVVELGSRFFRLEEGPRRRVASGMDARAALRVGEEAYDQIVLDTYANNVEVPPHLSTVEFFGEILARLEPGGWLVVNAAGFGLEDPVVEALGSTLASAFGERVLGLRVPFARNCVLVARRGDEPPEPGSRSWRFTGGEPARLLASLELPGAWRWFDPDARAPLTDDRNPIEVLQSRSLRAGRGRWLDRS